MNADAMYLLAVIETLKKEIDDLKTEKVNTLIKLEEAEKSVSMLKAENILLKMDKKDGKKHTQIEISKMRKKRNRAFVHARRIEIVTESKISKIDSSANAEIKKALNKTKVEVQTITDQKNKEILDWKEKFQKLETIVNNFNSYSNRINSNSLVFGGKYHLQRSVPMEKMLPTDMLPKKLPLPNSL